MSDAASDPGDVPPSVPAAPAVDDPEEEKETARIEALSDGVIAIAITLLIIEIGVPHLDEEHGSLFSAMWDQWPLYLAYAASFWSIGLAWVIHHQMFRCIRRFDHPLVLLNLVFLLVIAFVPHPTAIVGEYLREEGQQDAALAIYSATWLALAVALNLLWWYARSRGLISRLVDERDVAKLQRNVLLGIPLYLAVLLVTFVSFELTLVLYVVIAAVYTLSGPNIPLRRATHA